MKNKNPLTRLYRRIVQRLRAHEQHKNETAYRDGYDFAAGALLRDEMTPRQIEEMYWDGEPLAYFDKGCNDAIALLVAMGVVKDDRVNFS